MQGYKKDFVELAIHYKVLQFGRYELKSGRISPYFFNAGLFNDGAALLSLGRFYAQALQESGLAFDVLYGPAYKGIPLVSATAIALADQYQRNIPYCFNRKEPKKHGEGGLLIGAPLQGRVLIVDDVITAGMAVRESVALIEAAGATLAGILIAFDRQEKGRTKQSAIDEIKAAYDVPIVNIIGFNDLLEYLLLSQHQNAALIEAMQGYRKNYGA